MNELSVVRRWDNTDGTVEALGYDVIWYDMV